MSRAIDLLDGRWYASQPFDDWAWMREHAPAYWDDTNAVWALTRHADVLAVEKDPEEFQKFLDHYIYSVTDFQEYLVRCGGLKRMEALQRLENVIDGQMDA